jgi:hypothetical protein
MNNVASILILVFLAISFIQSGDKLFYWKDRLCSRGILQNDIKNHVPLALMNILILELISGIVCCRCHTTSSKWRKIIRLLWSYIFLYHFDHVTIWQRLAKDYDGATIVIYFIPAVIAVYWLN